MNNLTKIAIVEKWWPRKHCMERKKIKYLGSGQVQLQHTYVGLNFIDTYHRSGLYPLPLPTELGMEGSGFVTDKASDISNLEIGDRVAYVMELGSYSTHRNIQANKVIKIPDNISDQQAAAVLLKGMTVEYLVERLFL